MGFDELYYVPLQPTVGLQGSGTWCWSTTRNMRERYWGGHIHYRQDSARSTPHDQLGKIHDALPTLQIRFPRARFTLQGNALTGLTLTSNVPPIS